MNKAPFIYKYKLTQKTLSTLNIYKFVIRLKSQVIRKEDSRLVADRQTCKQFFCSCSIIVSEYDQEIALGTLDRHANHLSYKGGSKAPPYSFFVLTNLDCFDLGSSLKKLCFKPRQ